MVQFSKTNDLDEEPIYNYCNASKLGSNHILNASSWYLFYDNLIHFNV